MKKFNINKIAVATLIGLIAHVSSANGQSSDLSQPFSLSNFENATFYNKAVFDKKGQQNIKELPLGASAATFNTLITSLGKKGGVIRLTNGASDTDYSFDKTIKLTSNIRVEIEGGANIIVTKTKLLFDIATRSKKTTMRNVSITKFGDGVPTFDLSAYKPDGRFRLIKLGNVENFYIGDFNVQDNFSKYSVISFNPPVSKGDGLDVWQKGPHDGVVANITQYNGHVGYGVIQVQTAKNVLFKNLTGFGGITLRLETGENISNQLGYNVGTIDGIWAQNIESVNGHAALSLSPHGKINSNVFVDGLSSHNSAFTVSAQRGFINTGTVKSTTKGKISGVIDEGMRCNIDSSSYGYFTNVQLKGIETSRDKSISHHAQIKSKEFHFYELMNHGEFKRWKDMPKGSDSESKRGQAINSVRMSSAQSDTSLKTVGEKSTGHWAIYNEHGNLLNNADIKRGDNFPQADKIYDRKDVGLGGSKLKNCIIDVVADRAKIR